MGAGGTEPPSHLPSGVRPPPPPPWCGLPALEYCAQCTVVPSPFWCPFILHAEVPWLCPGLLCRSSFHVAKSHQPSPVIPTWDPYISPDVRFHCSQSHSFTYNLHTVFSLILYANIFRKSANMFMNIHTLVSIVATDTKTICDIIFTWAFLMLMRGWWIMTIFADQVRTMWNDTFWICHVYYFLKISWIFFFVSEICSSLSRCFVVLSLLTK